MLVVFYEESAVNVLKWSGKNSLALQLRFEHIEIVLNAFSSLACHGQSNFRSNAYVALWIDPLEQKSKHASD